MSLKQLVAVTTIHLTLEPGQPGDRSKGIRPVPPKVLVIDANTQFKAMNEEQETELLASGAARKATKDDSGLDKLEDEATENSAAERAKTREANAAKKAAADEAKKAEAAAKKAEADAKKAEGQTASATQTTATDNGDKPEQTDGSDDGSELV